jgi:hypothetical protein
MKTLCGIAVVGLVFLGHGGMGAGATLRDGNYLLKHCTEVV